MQSHGKATDGQPTALRNPSPVESPTDKASDPVYSLASPTVPDADRLALGWLLDSGKGKSPLEHLLAALIRCEAHATQEGDVWFAEDCRQAWIGLYKAFVTREFASYRAAEIATSYQMYGCHIDRLHERILARREALLGTASMRESEAGEMRSNALGLDTISPVLHLKEPLCVTPAPSSAALTTDCLVVAVTGAPILPAGTPTTTSLTIPTNTETTTNPNKKPSASVCHDRKRRDA